MGNLDTLKVAAVVLKDLKNNERVYKTALVKVASKEIYKAKTGKPYMEKDAYSGWGDFFNTVGTISNPIGWVWGTFGRKDSTDKGVKGEYDTYSNWGRALNYLGRAIGNKDSQVIYANSSEFSTPAEREAYLNDRINNAWTRDQTKYGLDLKKRALKNHNDWTMRKAQSTAEGQQYGQGYKQYQDDARHRIIMQQQDEMEKDMNEMYNNPGLLGGPYGTSPHVGGPANHIPRMYGPYAAGWYGGAPIGRGMYGGGYGRPYGSVYSRGGYGGRGYGGYGGYGGYAGYGYGGGYGAWPRPTWR